MIRSMGTRLPIEKAAKECFSFLALLKGALQVSLPSAAIDNKPATLRCSNAGKIVRASPWLNP
jgi:hypothetical protein